jgi:hypothetical protein
MNNVRKTMNQNAGGYSTSENLGKNEPTFPESEQASLEGIQQYFQTQATAPCA